jgi:hypothetical protein
MERERERERESFIRNNRPERRQFVRAPSADKSKDKIENEPEGGRVHVAISELVHGFLNLFGKRQCVCVRERERERER